MLPPHVLGLLRDVLAASPSAFPEGTTAEDLLQGLPQLPVSTFKTAILKGGNHVLGKGGQGCVYKATLDGKTVAIKVSSVWPVRCLLEACVLRPCGVLASHRQPAPLVLAVLLLALHYRLPLTCSFRFPPAPFITGFRSFTSRPPSSSTQTPAAVPQS